MTDPTVPLTTTSFQIEVKCPDLVEDICRDLGVPSGAYSGDYIYLEREVDSNMKIVGGRMLPAP